MTYRCKCPTGLILSKGKDHNKCVLEFIFFECVPSGGDRPGWTLREIILLKMGLNALIWMNVQCLHVMMDSDVIIHMAVLHVSMLMNVKR